MVAIIGVGAYATIAGPLASFRLWLVPVDAIDDGTAQHGIARIAGAALSVPPLIPALAVAALLSGWAMLDPWFRRPSRHLL